MTEKNRAIVYCRVSSDRQAREEKTSLDDQEKRGRAKAAELGLTIVRVQRDAESAWVLDKRSGFQRILEDARAGLFDVLIVDRMNRFSRSEDLSDPVIVLRTLTDAGVRVKFSERDYGDDLMGQFMKLADLMFSAKDQQDRRIYSRAGKVGRATKNKLPIPGRRAPYGYVWAPTPDGTLPKTELIRDPGPAQDVVKRIWNHFLHFTPTARHPAPSAHSIVTILSDERVPPPRVYQGIKSTGKARKHPVRPTGWAHQTIVNILRDPRYWGEAPDALLDSKYKDEQPPVPLPSYVRPGAAYVTPEEARRVHAMLGWNAASVGRPPKRDWGLLLKGGIVRCAYCGKRMDPHDTKIPRADGAPPYYYRCSTRRYYGSDPSKGGCSGVTINATELEHATIVALDEQVARGEYLSRLFAAWERNEGAAADAVRIAKAALDEAETNVANLAEWAMRTPPDSPAGATLQHRLVELNAVLPGLHKRYAQAEADVATIRANVTLAQELKEWFSAWMGGFLDLEPARQRQFLTSLHARVVVYREDDPDRLAAGLPRADLIAGLPTNASLLPPLPLDVAQARIDLEGIHELWASGFTTETPEERAAREKMWQNMTAEQVMERVTEEMARDGVRSPKRRGVPGVKAASSTARS